MKDNKKWIKDYLNFSDFDVENNRTITVGKLIDLVNDYESELNKSNIGSVSNSYHLTNQQYKQVQEHGGNEVRMISGGGIGITIECKNDENFWVDITDYSEW